VATNFSVSFKLTLLDGMSAGLKKMTASMKQAAAAANESSKKIGMFAKLGNKIGETAKGFLIANVVMKAGSAIVQFAQESKQAAKDLDALKISYQSVFDGDADKQMKFVRGEVNRLGLELKSTALAYMKIAAASKTSKVSNEDVKQVFIGVSEAATSLQLPAEQAEGALLALSQMISKGTVQAEELRGQLGERIPGAFSLAAKAMNMSEQELSKFMQAGKLTAEKFIPAFGKALRDQYASSAAAASKNFAAQENRFKNLAFNFKANIGYLMLPALAKLFSGITDLLQPLGDWIAKNKEAIGTGISNLFSELGVLIKIVLAILKPLLIIFMQLVKVLYKVRYALYFLVLWWAIYTGLTKAIIALSIIQTFLQLAKSIRMASIATWLLNAAMAANPMVWIALAIAAVIVGLVLLYKNWDLVVDKIAAGVDWVIEKLTMLKDLFMNYVAPLLTFGLVGGKGGSPAENVTGALSGIKEAGKNVISNKSQTDINLKVRSEGGAQTTIDKVSNKGNAKVKTQTNNGSTWGGMVTSGA
jgi:tape measure domain-containing protein